MGAKPPSVTDRRVQRTHGLLREALISLILERGYDAVSVKSVVQRAGVGRSTFYTHFGELEKLLLSGADGLQGWLRDLAAHGRSKGRAFGFTRALLEHAHVQRRLWRALIGKKGGVAVQQRFRQIVLELVREEVAAHATPQPADKLDGIVHYIGGAFGELLFWWLDSRTALTPADVDEIFHRLTGPALAGLTGSGKPNSSRH